MSGRSPMFRVMLSTNDMLSHFELLIIFMANLISVY